MENCTEAAPESAAAPAAPTTPAIAQIEGGVSENVEIKKIAQYLKAIRSSPVVPDEGAVSEFSDCETATVKSIVRKEFHKRMRNAFQLHKGNADYFLNAYETLMGKKGNDRSIVGYGVSAEQLIPAAICRLILRAKKQITNWTDLNRVMNNPYGISDQRLAEIVTQCLWNEITDGACAYMRHFTMTEDCSNKLKRCCNEPNMPLYDESDEEGGDADDESGDADDIGKKAVEEVAKPKSAAAAVCSDKDEVVHWIERKHKIGDNSHQKRLSKRELKGFTKRDGSGVLIYWLGQQSETPTLRKKNRTFFVDDFPESGELVIEYNSVAPRRKHLPPPPPPPPPPANDARGDNAGGLDMAEYDLILEEGLRLLGL